MLTRSYCPAQRGKPRGTRRRDRAAADSVPRMGAADDGVTPWTDDAVAAEFGELDTDLWWRAGYRFLPAELGLATGAARGARVLDVGCGTGGIARWIARTCGVRALAVDPSEAMIARAEPAPGVDYRVLRDGRLAAEDRSVVAAWAAFVYVCEPDLAVLERLTAEVHRVLRPGGRFTVLDSNPDTTGVAFDGLRQGEPGVRYRAGQRMPVDLRRRDGRWTRIADVHWPTRTYLDLLSGAGFADLAVRRPGVTAEDGRQAAPFMLVTGVRTE